ncbi:MAG TPA: tetratricopeptide repeat protein [Drouetiella sp.]
MSSANPVVSSDMRRSKLVNLLVLTSLVSCSVPISYAQGHSAKPAAHAKSAKSDAGAADDTSTQAIAQSEANDSKADEQSSINNESIEQNNKSTLRKIAENDGLEHYDLARYYWSRGNYKMADLEYQASIMYFPEMKASHRDWSILSLLTGHPMRAMAELMMVVGLGEPIPFTEPEAVEFKKRAAKIHNQQGIAWGRKSRWDRAIAEFQWALKYSPNNASIEHSLAFSYASKGDFENAERTYLASFSADPADGYARADFAFLLADNGGKDQAMKQLSEAVKLEPADPALHVDMGWMAESKGDLTTAQTEFQEAVKLSPKHAGLWAHLGKVFEREGKAKEASSAYAEAVALDPGQDEARARLEQLKNHPNEAPAATSTSGKREQS